MTRDPAHETADAEDLTVEEAHEGLRLDVFLAEALDEASRSFTKKLIKDGCVAINGQPCGKPARHVARGDRVEARIPPQPEPLPQPEAIPLDILFEDDDLLVVNKPAGLVVHPAPGHYTGTLVNAVLHHCPDFQNPGDDLRRPGIVHRLDRDTSGVMTVAKSMRGFAKLSAQSAAHAFERRYLALVRGAFKEDRGRISASIGRSMTDRKRMAVTGVRGKDAVTRFSVLEPLGPATLVALELETGRTHQIRVHMRFAGRPVLGDPVYGVTNYANWIIPPEVRAALEALPGQALHAELLGLRHPVTGEMMRFTAPPPPHFQHALEALRAHFGPEADGSGA